MHEQLKHMIHITLNKIPGLSLRPRGGRDNPEIQCTFHTQMYYKLIEVIKNMLRN